MKKTLLSILYCTLVLSSCTVEEFESSQIPNSVLVKITATQENETKTILDGALVKWAENDAIGLFTSGTKKWNQNNKFIADTINGTTAIFKSNVQNEEDTVTLYFYYPYADGNINKIVKFDYSEQVFSSSTDYGKYALLTGIAESVGDMNNIPGIKFKNSNTLFATNITNKSDEKYLIVKGINISVVGGESLFPIKGTYNLVDGSVTTIEKSDSISVKVGGDDGLAIAPGSTQTIPLFTMPVDLTGKEWNITITFSDQVKSIINSGKNYGLKKYNISYELIGSEVSAGTTESATASTAEQLITAGTNAKNIVLSENIQLDNMLSLSLAEDQVIDLNGKTLSAKAENLKGLLSINKTSENKVTIKNGTIDVTASIGQGDAIRIEESAKVTDVILEGVTIKAKGNGINNRALVGVNFNMTDCKVESNWFGIYQNGNVGGSIYTLDNCVVTDNQGAAVFISGTLGNGSTLNINGGTYTGLTAIEVKHANASIQNATLVATATSASYVASASGSCTDGYAFATTKNTGESGASGNIALSGCTLTLPTSATNNPIYNDGGAVVTQVIANGVTDVNGEYHISNKAGLFWVADQVNNQGNTFEGKTIKLTDNINLNNDSWTPIGNVFSIISSDNTFKGTFDGNNKTISNLKIIATDDAAGLFGYVQNNVAIKNVIIDNVNISAWHYAGAVVGYIQDNGSRNGLSVENCKVSNANIVVAPTLLSSGSYDYGDKAGAIAGLCVRDITFDGCSATNVSISGYRDLGGIIGHANTIGDKEITIKNCNVSNVNITQDFKNGYETAIAKVATVGSYYGRGSVSGSSVGNTGEAVITVKVQNTTSAQLALDCASTARTIEFAEGVYDKLSIRHTAPTSENYAGVGTRNYLRKLKDITIKSAEGANVFVGGFIISTGHIYQNSYDYVAGKEVNSGYTYYAYFDINNVVFDGLNLTETFYVGADSNTEENPFLAVDGLILQNLSREGTDVIKTTNGNVLVRIGNGTKRLNNVKVLNCSAKKIFQGVYSYGIVDYFVEGCTFDDLGHNVFQTRGGKSTFQNNTIKNCNSDRLFRQVSESFPIDDWIKILNNTVISSTGDAEDSVYPYFKSQTADIDITFTGNTMDGKAWTEINVKPE